MPGRVKPGKTGDRHLASINFPTDLLTYIDDLAKELNMNRSFLVVCILEDFKKSGKTIKLQIQVVD